MRVFKSLETEEMTNMHLKKRPRTESCGHEGNGEEKTRKQQVECLHNYLVLCVHQIGSRMKVTLMLAKDLFPTTPFLSAHVWLCIE